MTGRRCDQTKRLHSAILPFYIWGCRKPLNISVLLCRSLSETAKAERRNAGSMRSRCLRFVRRPSLPESQENRYKRLLEHIFFDKKFGAYKEGDKEIEFARGDLERAAKALRIDLPKNLGDVVDAIRYRTALPKKIIAIQPEEMEWVIEGVGRARYKFCLVPINRIVPNLQLRAIKVPDATPEIIAAYALNDEQALLAKVRYN